MVEEAKKEKRRKVLVTGSSGMLGVDLCHELRKRYDLIGLDIQPSAFSHQLSAFLECDITDKARTVKSITSAKPELVIHAAAWTDVDGCEREPDKARKINKEGTENIVLSASKLDIPLVYTSTDFVFDGKKKTPYTEEDRPNPMNVYAKSKLEGEKAMARLDTYIILRSGWLYGANGKNFVDTILEKAKRGAEELKIVDDQIGCPTYTRDLAKSIGKLLYAVCNVQCAVREIYHISNNGRVSWFDYAREILNIAGVNNISVIPIKSIHLDRPAKRPLFSVLDNSKFEKETAFIMRPWQEALEEYISSKHGDGNQ